MLRAGTGYIEVLGLPRFDFHVPDGAETARLLIVAPNREEAAAMEADTNRLAFFRNGFNLMTNQLFGAMPIDFSAMLDASKEWHPPEPHYATCNTVPELGESAPEWLERHEIGIIGDACWQHAPMLDKMRAVDKSGWAATVALLMNGIQGEPITIAITPRSCVEAVLRHVGDPAQIAQLLPLRGFATVFAALADEGRTIRVLNIHLF